MESEGAARLRSALETYLLASRDQARSDCHAMHRVWAAHDAMFNAMFVDPETEGPFKELYVAKMAPLLERMKATLIASVIPDEAAMDFFQPMVHRVRDDQNPSLELEGYANMQAAVLRHSLVESGFADKLDPAVISWIVRGNMFLMAVWEQEMQTITTRTPNPVYTLDDQSLAALDMRHISPDAIVKWDDHIESWVMVEKIIVSQESVLAPGLPATRYLNPYNVWATEQDRDGLESCTGAWVFDVPDPDDILRDEIRVDKYGATIGNYDLRGLGCPDEDREPTRLEMINALLRTSVSTVNGADGPENFGQFGNFGATPLHVRRMERFTYNGRIDWDLVCENADVERHGPEWQEVMLGFNADLEEARRKKTWLVEMIGGDGAVEVRRCQPLPYRFDRIPITHGRLNKDDNLTYGWGEYQREEVPERIWNMLNRNALHATQMLANPPVVTHEDQLRLDDMAVTGGINSLSPGQILRAAGPAGMGSPVEVLKLPADSLSFIERACQSIEAQMSASTGVSGAMAGGGQGLATSAAEKIAAASADALFGEKARRLAGILCRHVATLAALCKQYMDEPQRVPRLDDQGKPATYAVPPEAWDVDVLWYAVGPNTAGNRDNQIQAITQLAKAAQEEGRLNFDEFAKRMGRLTNVPNMRSLIDQPPPPERYAKRTAFSLTGDIVNTPAEVSIELLAGSGNPLSEKAQNAWINAQAATATALAVLKGSTGPDDAPAMQAAVPQ